MDQKERKEGTKALEALPWVSKLEGAGVIGRMFTQVCSGLLGTSRPFSLDNPFQRLSLTFTVSHSHLRVTR